MIDGKQVPGTGTTDQQRGTGRDPIESVRETVPLLAGALAVAGLYGGMLAGVPDGVFGWVAFLAGGPIVGGAAVGVLADGRTSPLRQGLLAAVVGVGGGVLLNAAWHGVVATAHVGDAVAISVWTGILYSLLLVLPWMAVTGVVADYVYH